MINKNFGTPLETIKYVLFYDKNLNQVLQGTLILAQGSVYEIELKDGRSYAYANMYDLLKDWDFGTLPFEKNKLNFIQRLIMKIFKIK